MELVEYIEQLEHTLHGTLSDPHIDATMEVLDVAPEPFFTVLSLKLQDAKPLTCMCGGCIEDLVTHKLLVAGAGLRCVEHTLQHRLEAEDSLVAQVREQFEDLLKALQIELEGEKNKSAVVCFSLQTMWNILSIADEAVRDRDYDLEAAARNMKEDEGQRGRMDVGDLMEFANELTEKLQDMAGGEVELHIMQVPQPDPVN